MLRSTQTLADILAAKTKRLKYCINTNPSNTEILQLHSNTLFTYEIYFLVNFLKQVSKFPSFSKFSNHLLNLFISVSFQNVHLIVQYMGTDIPTNMNISFFMEI